MIVMLHDTPFKANHVGAALHVRKLVAEAEKWAASVEADYSNAVAAGDHALQAALQAQLLVDPRSHLRSVVAAARKMPFGRRPALDHCPSIAEGINIGEQLDEAVKIRPEPKKSGGFRVVQDFGPRHRTQQDVIARVLGPHFKPRPWQYGHRGVQHAIRAVKDLMAEGFAYGAKLDIRDFFSSFELELLAPELPLPWQVAEHAVVGRHHKVELSNKGNGHQPLSLTALQMTDLIYQARRGLPTGSGSSPIVAGVMMSRLPWATTVSQKLVNYVDDFLLLAESLAAREEGIKMLMDAAAQLPGGQFDLKLVAKYHVDKGIDFLGHQFTRNADGAVKTSVGIRGWNGLDNRIVELDFNANASYSMQLKRLAQMLAYLRGWGRAFSACDDMKNIYSFWFEEISAMAKASGITMAEVEKAMEAWM